MNFFLCILKGSCEYSIKKLLAILFSMLIFYVVIFTTKDYYELLLFVASLLAIRSYDKTTMKKQE